MEKNIWVTTLEDLKEKCNDDLFVIGNQADIRNKYGYNEIRYIKDNEFGYTNYGKVFFFDDTMYLITKDERYKEDHNPDIHQIDDRLDVLNYTGNYLVRVIFAGFYTGYKDNKGNKIFTGDLVNAWIFPNLDQCTDHILPKTGSEVVAGIDMIGTEYQIILDNISIPIYWTTYIEIIGTVFYDMHPQEIEVDIRDKCNLIAQYRGDKSIIINKMKHTPSYHKDVKKKMYRKHLVGLSGELAVAKALCEKGFVPTLANNNCPVFDIFCFNPYTKQTIVIQVKTVKDRLGNKKNTFPIMSNRDNRQEFYDNVSGPYVFVHIDINNQYSFFILSKEQFIETSSKIEDDYDKKERKIPLNPGSPMAYPIKNLDVFKDKWENLWL